MTNYLFFKAVASTTNPDLCNTVIEKDAIFYDFKQGALPLCYEHSPTDVIGGVYDMLYDENGRYVVFGYLDISNELAKSVANDIVNDKSSRSLSVAGLVKSSQSKKGTPIKVFEDGTIGYLVNSLELKEISVVEHPMNQDAKFLDISFDALKMDISRGMNAIESTIAKINKIIKELNKKGLDFKKKISSYSSLEEVIDFIGNITNLPSDILQNNLILEHMGKNITQEEVKEEAQEEVKEEAQEEAQEEVKEEAQEESVEKSVKTTEKAQASKKLNGFYSLPANTKEATFKDRILGIVNDKKYKNLGSNFAEEFVIRSLKQVEGESLKRSSFGVSDFDALGSVLDQRMLSYFYEEVVLSSVATSPAVGLAGGSGKIILVGDVPSVRVKYYVPRFFKANNSVVDRQPFTVPFENGVNDVATVKEKVIPLELYNYRVPYSQMLIDLRRIENVEDALENLRQYAHSPNMPVSGFTEFIYRIFFGSDVPNTDIMANKTTEGVFEGSRLANAISLAEATNTTAGLDPEKPIIADFPKADYDIICSETGSSDAEIKARSFSINKFVRLLTNVNVFLTGRRILGRNLILSNNRLFYTGLSAGMGTDGRSLGYSLSAYQPYAMSDFVGFGSVVDPYFSHPTTTTVGTMIGFAGDFSAYYKISHIPTVFNSMTPNQNGTGGFMNYNTYAVGFVSNSAAGVLIRLS